MNISNVLYFTGSQERGRIDIMLNWSKNIPRRLKPREEFDLKYIKSSDFAKKLMGQLVFMYFLNCESYISL